MSVFVDTLVEVGFLPNNEIDEYVKNTPGLQEIYPVLCKFSASSGEEITDVVASFLILGYKIGLNTVDPNKNMQEECDDYIGKFEEIFSEIGNHNLEAARKLADLLTIEITESPTGLADNMLAEVYSLLDKFDIVEETPVETEINEEVEENPCISCEDFSCPDREEEEEVPFDEEIPEMNVDQPISVTFDNGKVLTFTPQDVINYCINENTKDSEVNHWSY